ncbi:MAG: ABC transporter substrate-binding protein [Lentisphaeria bacterium]|nr:ABC transporter substrate-binding protein [Lentisphaeria bacterium]
MKLFEHKLYYNFFLGVLVFAGLNFAANGEIIRETPQSVTFRQADGQSVVVLKHPKNVVAGYFSLGLAYLHCGGRLAGIIAPGAASELTEDLQNLPKVGGGMQPDLERIMLLQPDLVLLSERITRHQTTAAALRRLGVTVLQLKCNNYGDYLDILELFCRLNDQGKIVDIPVLKKMVEQVDEICRRTKIVMAKVKLRCAVIFVSGSGFSLESAAGNTGNMLARLGVENIRKTTEPYRQIFSMEHFILANPELIFVICMGNTQALQDKFKRQIFANSAFANLQAVKSGHIYYLDEALFLFQPGKRFPEAFEILSRHILSAAADYGEKVSATFVNTKKQNKDISE